MVWAPEPEKGYAAEYQKWDYITLDDFRNKSFANVFWYMWLWMLAIISIAVYSADTFTAVNLLAYNKWSSSVHTSIPISISKWIFAGCILLSWALCAYEWIRAIRVLRRGNVAENYLDPLAVTLQSIRLGSGRGWRRFLVFSELTNSRKGADYVALFSYFQFKCAIRLVLADGPRQVINADTLYGVMKANVIPIGANAAPTGKSNFAQFWSNVDTLYSQNVRSAVIYSTMLFSLTIWVFSALCLIIAVLLWVAFLWHYIPSDDGTLAKYCRRKVDGRLAKICSKKVTQAIEEQEKKRKREEEKLAKKKNAAQRPAAPGRAPTLPSLAGTEDDASLDFKPGISRETTQTSLAPSSYRQPTLPGVDDDDDFGSMSRQPTLPSLAGDSEHSSPPYLSRSETQSSGTSFNTYSSNRPLLQGAAGMGRAPPNGGNGPYRGPPSAFARTNSGFSNPPPFERSMTGSSQGSYNPSPGMARNGPPPNRGYPPPAYFNAAPPPNRPLPNFPRSNSDFPSRPPVGRNLTGGFPGPDRGFAPPPRSQTDPGYSEGPESRPSTGVARNFSLLNREQTPSPVDDGSGSDEGPAYEMQPQQKPAPGGTSPPPAPPVLPKSRPASPYRAYKPYNPSIQQPTPAAQSEQPHLRTASNSSSAPTPQQGSPPRRVTTNLPDHDNLPRPQPPRRVGTAPLPSNPYMRSDSVSLPQPPIARPGTAEPPQGPYGGGQRYDDNFV